MTDRVNFGDGALYFPVTPFDSQDAVDHDLLVEHISSRLPFAPGGVFPACGTGEFHALSASEAIDVVRSTVSCVAGAVPVVAGTGGPLGHAVEVARGAADAGADALLLLPPYLMTGTTDGLVRWVETVAAATPLPVVLYHRANARYTPEAIRRLAENPKLAGFKDGIGDIGLAQEIVLAARASGRDLALFNGLLTAELSQAAYRAIGIPLYSSAVFAMLPEIATLHYRAYARGDDELRIELLERFYSPFVQLRDETPGFGVSLVKAGIRLRGVDVGSVRPPLVDPDPDQLRRLEQLLESGLALAESVGALEGQR